MRGPKLRRAQIEGSKTPLGKLVFNLYPAEFNLRLQSFGPLKVCPQSFGAMQNTVISESYTINMTIFKEIIIFRDGTFTVHLEILKKNSLTITLHFFYLKAKGVQSRLYRHLGN